MKQSDISMSSSSSKTHDHTCCTSSNMVQFCGYTPMVPSFPMGSMMVPCSSEMDQENLSKTYAEAARIAETGQIRSFNTHYAQQIKGYPKTALVSDPKDPSRLFISTVDDNNTDPTSAASKGWFPLTDSVASLNEALRTETARAKAAEETLQPKGDYATNTGLNAETERAKAAESILQPKGNYATNDALNAETNRAKAAEATFQPKGDYATTKSLSAEVSVETERAKAVEATLQPKGDYATNDSLNAEASRAKSAEAALQPKGDYASNTDLSSEIERAKTVEGTLQPKGNYATDSDLNTEAQAREAATKTLDQNKVNRSGDTMTGNLVIAGGGQWEKWIYGGKVISIIEGKPENAFLQSQLVSGQPCAVVGVQDASKNWHTWYFNSVDGTVTPPSGNAIPEVIGAQGRTVIQAWKTECKNHDWISFPQEFLGKPISLQLTAEHVPNSALSTCVGYYESTLTAQGFQVDLRWINDSSSGAQTDPLTINILAIGPM